MNQGLLAKPVCHVSGFLCMFHLNDACLRELALSQCPRAVGRWPFIMSQQRFWGETTLFIPNLRVCSGRLGVLVNHSSRLGEAGAGPAGTGAAVFAIPFCRMK